MPYEIEIEKPMRSYLITYNYPMRYRGSYLVTAVDGIQASKKVQDYLHKKWGHAGDEMSIVTEIYDNGIQVIG